MPPTLVTVHGSLYHPATGAKITTGTLFLQPKTFIVSNGELVSAAKVAVVVPGSGNLSFQISPSYGVAYQVEFDPNPSDTTTPLPLKSGYWKNAWLIPSSGPVNIATL